MFDQILIPTDRSEHTRKATRNGINLAAEHGATVHVLYVVEPIPLGQFASGPKPASAEHGDAVEEQRSERQDAIEEVTTLAKEHEVPVVEAIEYGNPHEEIIEYAENEGIDVIVLGTHGRSGQAGSSWGASPKKSPAKARPPC